MVLSRLCSSNWRALVCPSRPARTLGCAAASITQSTGGSDIYIAGHAKIAVHQLHAKPLQRQPVGFAALARQIVQSYDLDPFVRLQKGSSQVAARKSAYARNQNPHAGFLFRTIMNLWQS